MGRHRLRGDTSRFTSNCSMTKQPSPNKIVTSLRWLWLVTIFGIPILFILLPLATFLLYGFWHVKNGEIINSISLINYREFLFNESYRQVFVSTLTLAFQVSVINFFLGYAVAFFISRQSHTVKYLLVLSAIVPLLMSYIIKIYAIRGLLGTKGLLNQFLMFIGIISEPSDLFLFNLTAVLITLSIVLLPFTIIPIFIALERIPKSLSAASADLGGNAWHTFRYITWPMSLPGSVVGVMFVFVLAVGDFLAPQLVGGTRGFTYGRLVYSQFGMAYNWPLGAALTVILLIVSMSIILISGRLATPRWQRH
jgi:spermidine/putrescine transport system permease protein